jgi:hypothetical protein
VVIQVRDVVDYIFSREKIGATQIGDRFRDTGGLESRAAVFRVDNDEQEGIRFKE